MSGNDIIMGYTYSQYHRSSARRGGPRTFVKVGKRLTSFGTKRVRNVYRMVPDTGKEYVLFHGYFHAI